jgi:2-phospho-L-lactate transferase/gluconeogenesis factor (CofD/UPF0052 family)
MMRAIGVGANSLAVSRLYGRLIDCMMVDPADSQDAKAIEREGIEAVESPILMRNLEDEARLAREVMTA